MKDKRPGSQAPPYNGEAMTSEGEQPAYQAIVNTAIDGILVIDQKGIIQSCNPAAERIYGYDADEIIGQNVKMLIPPDGGIFNDCIGSYLGTDVGIVVGRACEVEGRRKDGSPVPLDLTISEWTSNGQRLFTGIARDLTYRKLFEQETRGSLEERGDLEKLNQSLEKRIRQEIAEREAVPRASAQAARLQALGELAGGIAHDFNNVLQAISGAADLVRGRLDRPGMIIRQMQTIENAVKRGASISERLLAFARRSNLRAAPLDVAALLDDLARLLAQTLGVSVTIRIEVEASLPLMMADKGTL